MALCRRCSNPAVSSVASFAAFGDTSVEAVLSACTQCFANEYTKTVAPFLPDNAHIKARLETALARTEKWICPSCDKPDLESRRCDRCQYDRFSQDNTLSVVDDDDPDQIPACAIHSTLRKCVRCTFGNAQTADGTSCYKCGGHNLCRQEARSEDVADEERRTGEERLATRLASVNARRDPPSDPDCLFRALASLLLGEPEWHRLVRQLIASFLQHDNAARDFKDLFGTTDDLKEYLDGLLVKEGDTLTVRLAARLFRVTVVAVAGEEVAKFEEPSPGELPRPIIILACSAADRNDFTAVDVVPFHPLADGRPFRLRLFAMLSAALSDFTSPQVARPRRFRIVVEGDTGSGKTTLCNSILGRRIESTQGRRKGTSERTIGFDVHCCTVTPGHKLAEDYNFKAKGSDLLEVWDFGGEEQFQYLSELMKHDSNTTDNRTIGVSAVVLDLSGSNWEDRMAYHLTYHKTDRSRFKEQYVVGTHADLVANQTIEKFKSLARKYDRPTDSFIVSGRSRDEVRSTILRQALHPSAAACQVEAQGSHEDPRITAAIVRTVFGLDSSENRVYSGREHVGEFHWNVISQRLSDEFKRQFKNPPIASEPSVSQTPAVAQATIVSGGPVAPTAGAAAGATAVAAPAPGAPAAAAGSPADAAPEAPAATTGTPTAPRGTAATRDHHAAARELAEARAMSLRQVAAPTSLQKYFDTVIQQYLLGKKANQEVYYSFPLLCYRLVGRVENTTSNLVHFVAREVKTRSNVARFYFTIDDTFKQVCRREPTQTWRQGRALDGFVVQWCVMRRSQIEATGPDDDDGQRFVVSMTNDNPDLVREFKMRLNLEDRDQLSTLGSVEQHDRQEHTARDHLKRAFADDVAMSELHCHLKGLGDHQFWLDYVVCRLLPHRLRARKADDTHRAVMREKFEEYARRANSDIEDASIDVVFERRFSFDVVYSVDVLKQALLRMDESSQLAEVNRRQEPMDGLWKLEAILTNTPETIFAENFRTYFVFNEEANAIEKIRGVTNAFLCAILESLEERVVPPAPPTNNAAPALPPMLPDARGPVAKTIEARLRNAFTMLGRGGDDAEPFDLIDYRGSFSPEFYPARYAMKDPIFAQCKAMYPFLINHVASRYLSSNVTYVEFSMSRKDVENEEVLKACDLALNPSSELGIGVPNFAPSKKFTFKFLAGFPRSRAAYSALTTRNMPTSLLDLWTTEPLPTAKMWTVRQRREFVAALGPIYNECLDGVIEVIFAAELDALENLVVNVRRSPLLRKYLVGVDNLSEEDGFACSPFGHHRALRSLSKIQRMIPTFGVRLHSGEGCRYGATTSLEDKLFRANFRGHLEIAFVEMRRIRRAGLLLRIGHGVSFLRCDTFLSKPLDGDLFNTKGYFYDGWRILRWLRDEKICLELNMTSNEYLMPEMHIDPSSPQVNGPFTLRAMLNLKLTVTLSTDNDGIWPCETTVAGLPMFALKAEYAKAAQCGFTSDQLKALIDNGNTFRFDRVAPAAALGAAVGAAPAAAAPPP